MHTLKSFGSAKNFYCCRLLARVRADIPLEVLRISTVVDSVELANRLSPLEVLRISTVVDSILPHLSLLPLEVLRISTVVDPRYTAFPLLPLEVLRISTVVDKSTGLPQIPHLWKC